MIAAGSFKLMILSSFWLSSDDQIMVENSRSSDSAIFCGGSMTSGFRMTLFCGIADPGQLEKCFRLNSGHFFI
jgi:hypothetical protein